MTCGSDINAAGMTMEYLRGLLLIECSRLMPPRTLCHTNTSDETSGAILPPGISNRLILLIGLKGQTPFTSVFHSRFQYQIHDGRSRTSVLSVLTVEVPDCQDYCSFSLLVPLCFFRPSRRCALEAHVKSIPSDLVERSSTVLMYHPLLLIHLT